MIELLMSSKIASFYKVIFNKVFLFVFILFATSFPFSIIGDFYFDITGYWTMPFLFISLIPGTPAFLIGGYFTEPWKSGSIMPFNRQLSVFAYFLISFILALCVSIIFNRKQKSNLTV